MPSALPLLNLSPPLFRLDEIIPPPRTFTAPNRAIHRLHLPSSLVHFIGWGFPLRVGVTYRLSLDAFFRLYICVLCGTLNIFTVNSIFSL